MATLTSLPPFAGPAVRASARLVFADGTVIEGLGFGAQGAPRSAKFASTTAMTGYQEILTDPSYAGQIIAFTFPHIGNVGTNTEDLESITPAARGIILRADASSPSNYRSLSALGEWLKRHNIVGIAGIDTRALTRRVRERGAPNAVIAHDAGAAFDLEALNRRAREWPGLEGMDLAKEVTARQSVNWDETLWTWNEGYGRNGREGFPHRRHRLRHQAQHPALPRQPRWRGHRRAGGDIGGRYSRA